MSVKTYKRLGVLGILVSALFTGGAQCIPDPNGPSTEKVYVNLQVDAELEDVEGITKLVDELKRRGILTTIYVTADYANANALLIQDFYSDRFEIALHGYTTGEQLATMDYETQLDLLTRAMGALEGCWSCGTGKNITGFRPQYFSHNEDTYRILDGLGLQYNCGYKAGLLFEEGHDSDVTPYPVDNHDFYAVPATVVEYEGEDTYLCDIACANVQEMTGAQWGALLSTAWARCLERKEPLVALIHGWHSGTDEDYWQAFVDFLDEIEDQAEFVTTQELVDHYSSLE